MALSLLLTLLDCVENNVGKTSDYKRVLQAEDYARYLVTIANATP